MTKCICGSITTGEKSIHVCANNGMQRAAFNLLNRLFGAQQIQIVFDIFIENILSELVHLPQDLILVFRQTCLTIAIWTIECDIDWLVSLLLNVIHGTPGPCIAVTLFLTLFLQSLLLCNPIHDFIVLATFMKIRWHILNQSRSAPVLKILQATLPFEVYTPRIQLTWSWKCKWVLRTTRNLAKVMICCANLHRLIRSGTSMACKCNGSTCLRIISFFIINIFL